jgi:hypothetical protein
MKGRGRRSLGPKKAVLCFICQVPFCVICGMSYLRFLRTKPNLQYVSLIAIMDPIYLTGIQDPQLQPELLRCNHTAQSAADTEWLCVLQSTVYSEYIDIFSDGFSRPAAVLLASCFDFIVEYWSRFLYGISSARGLHLNLNLL